MSVLIGELSAVGVARMGTICWVERNVLWYSLEARIKYNIVVRVAVLPVGLQFRTIQMGIVLAKFAVPNGSIRYAPFYDFPYH